MILVKNEILAARARGEIVIEPFDRELVSINSVDVRLGPDMWYLSRYPKNSFRDVYRQADVGDGDWHKLAFCNAKHVRESMFPDWAPHIPDSAQVFILQPGYHYIGTTLEKIGSVAPHDPKERSLIPMMGAKSTFGRHGLTVALCAGKGDVGYCSRWALEIHVAGSQSIPLAVGTVVGQVTFYVGGYTPIGYGGSEHYQNDNEVTFLPKALQVK
jgi:deoxycytidine triphosphate deaminase